MKVICNRGALLDGLLMAGNVVASRTPKPVLQCVKLTAEENTLTIAATDLEVAIRYSDNQVQIERAGEALVPADKLRDIVRESVDDTLSIEVANDNATIKGQDSKFTIYTQNPKEFPPVPDFTGEADFEIAGGHLKQLIGQTLFAAAKESTRYAFNGVLVVAKGKTISTADLAPIRWGNSDPVQLKASPLFRALLPLLKKPNADVKAFLVSRDVAGGADAPEARATGVLTVAAKPARKRK